MNLADKLILAAKNQKTYRVGLLQTRAYRILKQCTAAALESSGIGTAQWAFLGLLNDRAKGIRPAEAARELMVEAPFVTQMVGELKKKKLVDSSPDETDTRAKILSLTAKGRAFVAETEAALREKMRPLVRGVSRSDLIAYIAVLQQMIENHADSDTNTNLPN